MKLFERSTTDLLIIMIAGTICFSVLAAGATVGIIEITNPTVDTSQAVGMIADVINTLIGLLAGFLAGRTQAHMTIEQDRIEAYSQRRAERSAGRADESA
jgi:hypothetical protein